MKIHRVARLSIGFVVAAVSTTASASTQVETVCDSEQTGENCDCQPLWDGGPIQCYCTPVYSEVCRQVTVEVGPTTPTPVYRFFDGKHHVYSTSDNPPAGYSDEGVKFHIANDGAYGGVEFASLSSGQGWIFPDSDTTAVSMDAGLQELYLFHNIATGDNLFTLDPNDPDLVSYQGSVYCANPPTCSNIVVDEYEGGGFGMMAGR
jgi:hypothetical protein